MTYCLMYTEVFVRFNSPPVRNQTDICLTSDLYLDIQHDQSKNLPKWQPKSGEAS